MDKKLLTFSLGNNMLAGLQFSQNDNGTWTCTMANQTMRDIECLLNGEPLKQEYVEPWFGDIL